MEEAVMPRDGFSSLPEKAKENWDKIFPADIETAAEQSKAFADPEAALINEQAEREGKYHGE